MKYTVIQAFLLVGLWQFANGQSTGELKSFNPSKGTVCYMGTTNAFTTVPAPEAFLRQRKSGARTKTTANIEVTYQDFSPEAQAAFQYAVEIWESLLTTDITIHVLARWAPLGENVLGSASPGTYYTNFDGAPKMGVWYPVSLAEKLAGKELNASSEPDIVATFNSANPNWHYGIDTNPASGKFDLVSIVLHEIGHGLGITHAYSYENGQGIISQGFQNLPTVFESNLENFDNQNIVAGFQQPSVELGGLIVGGPLLFNSQEVRVANNGLRAQIYTPGTYAPGSSIAHLNESTFPAGNANSLMTPFIAPAEKNHDPGPISQAILNDIGWLNTAIKHQPLKNTEDVTAEFLVTCIVASDNGFKANSLQVNYTIDGGNTVSMEMTPTGNSNEFSVTLPNGGTKYSYYISLSDSANRPMTKPGRVFVQGQPIEQARYAFEAGPDHQAPFINHVPRAFIVNTDPLLVEAIISDNIGINEVSLDYRINGVAKTPMTMPLKAGTDSTYTKEITFAPGEIQIDDLIEYRIQAKDASIAGNIRVAPSANSYYSVVVTGLEATRDAYENNFNAGSDDFFGNGFSIIDQPGFLTKAIHSTHPYLQGTGFPGDSLESVYQLKIPVRIAAESPIMKFDEVVLVEPGESGSVFGDADFFDYVVVEGSTDGGKTWKAVADGYDSRAQNAWLERYNSEIVNNSSTGVGDSTLFRTRSLNLLNEFEVGDEVAFRFRLHSDPLAAGWGWAIDNLKIQIDDTAPQILHQQQDYLLAGTAAIDILLKSTDLSGLSSLKVEYRLNSEPVASSELIIDEKVDTYSLRLAFANDLVAGDFFYYRIVSVDGVGNKGYLPSSDNFLKVAVVSFSNPVGSFVADFDGDVSAVSGNYFSVRQPTGFPTKAMHSDHPYPFGLGIETSFSSGWLVTKPIRVDATNPYVSYDEIVVVDYAPTNLLKDNVVVEATKDGVNWQPLETAYGTTKFPEWKVSFDNSGTPNNTLIRNHRVNLLSSGTLKANDVILIRFRLNADATKSGWGWMVDNLSIQGPITGIRESATALKLIAFPNPARDAVHVQLDQPEAEGYLQIYSAQGVLLETRSVPASQAFQTELQVSGWPAGIYVARFSSTLGTVSTRFAVVK